MALDLGVSTGLLEVLERRRRRPASEAAIWPAFASWSEKAPTGWTVLRRIPLADMVRDPRVLDEILDRIEASLHAQVHGGDPADLAPLRISLPALCDDGFDIDVSVDGRRIDASFGGLDQEFADAASAMTWIRRAVSGRYRLTIVSFDDIPCEWRLAPVHPSLDDHLELASGRRPLLALFRPRQTTIRCNRLPENR